MATRSIYHKACPACAALIEVSLDQCHCGYSFSSVIENGELMTEEQTLRDEELLTEYLNARIGQAVTELQTVQKILSEDPKNMEKANKLMQAFMQVHELRTELEMQTTKLEQAKEAIRVARQERGEEGLDVAIESAEPTDEFRTAQSAKAGKIMQETDIKMKDCPKCRQTLPEPAVLCFCGFRFSTGESTLPKTAEEAPAPLSRSTPNRR